MSSPRFSFSFSESIPTSTPFATLPEALACTMTACQIEATNRLYQIAWERTQAVLKPTKVEKLFVPCLN